MKITKIRKIQTAQGERFEVRGWDGTGSERIEWRRRFESHRDARVFVDERVYVEREKLRTARDTETVPLSQTTFREQHSHWIECKAGKLSPSYERDVQIYWREFEPLLADLPLSKFTAGYVQRLEAELTRKGNSKATIRKKVAWLKSVLNFAVAGGLIPVNPIEKARTTKPEEPEIEFWRAQEAQSFLAFARKRYEKGSRLEFVYLAYLTALNTALRAGELWALKPKNLEPSASLIHVVEQFDLRTKTFRPTKGKRGRRVTLPPSLATLLVEFVEGKGIGSDEPIFASQRGTPMDHNNFKNRYFKKDVRDWGGRAISFHALRHSAATLMLSSGIDIRTVQTVLGHQDVSTSQRYTHALSENVSAAARVFSVQPTESPQASSEGVRPRLAIVRRE